METKEAMRGLLGKKIGMTRVFDKTGSPKAATVIEAGPCMVVQVKTMSKEGYNSVQLGFQEKKETRTTKALLGHFGHSKNAAEAAKTPKATKAKMPPQRILREFRNFEVDVKAGDQVRVDIFKEGELVHVSSISKGRGFQGVVKRHKFSGGPKSHGESDRVRAPGSIGSSSFPKRVFKGLRMGGRMGFDRVTIRNMEILKVVPDRNLILVKGGVPGARNTIVEIHR
jgi:large subunit ribosomal protein L3